MEAKILWQQGNSNPENLNNFAVIAQWWSNLADKEVSFAQRLISPGEAVETSDWDTQRFDEVFEIKNPETRGITLYWRKPDLPQERNTTPHQLLLDTRNQQLYIFPQSQKQLAIRVMLRELLYETIAVKNPQWQYQRSGENHVLILRDNQQQRQVKVTLTQDNLSQLKEQLP